MLSSCSRRIRCDRTSRNKIDRTDANGILEAHRNADIRPVPVRSVSQQVLGAIHRFRSGWIAARTAQVNTLRGLLRELGIVIPEGVEKVIPQVRFFLADADSGIPDSLRSTIAASCDEIESLGAQIRQAERDLEALAEETPVVARLRSIPGIGLMTGTALVAFVMDIQRFPSGRHFASCLPVTLIHGARPVLCHAEKAARHDRLRIWALALQKRTRHNKAAVALANKLARIVWAVWKHGREFESMPHAA